jgi:hypothetical protein
MSARENAARFRLWGRLLPRPRARPPVSPGVLTALILALASPARAQSGWQGEIGFTLPANVPMPLLITQDEQPDLDFTARYASKPFNPPVTWQLRVGRWSQGRSWELELIHHKMYLENGPDEVEAFSISHGYNLLTLQRGWRHEHFQWRVGGGMVIAHVENTVRGLKLEEVGGTFGGGYYATGPAVSGAVARPLRLGKGAFINLEAKLAFAHASVPVVDGRARGFAFFAQIAVLLGYGPEGKTQQLDSATAVIE